MISRRELECVRCWEIESVSAMSVGCVCSGETESGAIVQVPYYGYANIQYNSMIVSVILLIYIYIYITHNSFINKKSVASK